MAESKPKGSPKQISAEEFAKGWDSERRIHELNPLLFNLRGSTMYVPARTKQDMDDVMGGPTPAVRTRTFPGEFRVWISPCLVAEPDSRRLRSTSDTQGAAAFGFAIPLRKMTLKVPETRQYSFEAKRLPVEGGGVIYEISFRDFQNQRRDIDENKLAAAKKARAEKARAKRLQKPPGAAAEAPEAAPNGSDPSTETAAGYDPTDDES